MLDFQEKVVIVTGAAGNLGRAVARAFLDAGARLALPDRSRDRLAALYPELDVSPDHALIGGVDLTADNSVEDAFNQVAARFGRIDVLVNTAGGYRAGRAAHEEAAENWQLLLDLNFRTTLNASRAVAPHMIKQLSGAIVNTASLDALEARAGAAAYGVSKAAVLRLTEAMSAELRPYGIRVNCILPGIIDTPQNRAAMPDADRTSWLRPEAVAGAVLLLCSEEARAISGVGLPLTA